MEALAPNRLGEEEAWQLVQEQLRGKDGKSMLNTVVYASVWKSAAIAKRIIRCPQSTRSCGQTPLPAEIVAVVAIQNGSLQHATSELRAFSIVLVESLLDFMDLLRQDVDLRWQV